MHVTRKQNDLKQICSKPVIGAVFAICPGCKQEQPVIVMDIIQKKNAERYGNVVNQIKAVEAGDSASFTRALLGDLYSGVGGSNKTDFEKAIEWYTKSMEVDDPSPYGMYQLGNIYYQGYGGKTDYEKAFALFNRAVEIWKAQNSTDAIFPYTVEQIGDMYSNGRGVEKDTDKAAEYYKWADELNSR